MQVKEPGIWLDTGATGATGASSTRTVVPAPSKANKHMDIQPKQLFG